MSDLCDLNELCTEESGTQTLTRACVWVLGMHDLKTALCVYEVCRAQGVLLYVMAMKVP